MTYCTEAEVQAFTGFTTIEVSSAAMGTILARVDDEINDLTGKIWTGTQDHEHCGRGDGTTNTFYVSYKPVLSAVGGTVSNDPSEITVKVDGTTQESTVYALLGNEGRIRFDDDNIPAADDKIEVTYAYGLNKVKMAAILLTASYCYAKQQNETAQKAAEWYYNKAMKKINELKNKRVDLSWSS